VISLGFLSNAVGYVLPLSSAFADVTPITCSSVNNNAVPSVDDTGLDVFGVGASITNYSVGDCVGLSLADAVVGGGVDISLTDELRMEGDNVGDNEVVGDRVASCSFGII